MKITASSLQRRMRRAGPWPRGLWGCSPRAAPAAPPNDTEQRVQVWWLVGHTCSRPVTDLVSRTCDIASGLSCIQRLFSIVPRCWSKRCFPLTQTADTEGTRSFIFQLLPAVFLQSRGKYIALFLFCEALKQFSTVVQYLCCSFWSLEPCKYD